MHILVIGGGIGGLTTALALRQAGHNVQVFEQSPEIREVGAGLTLWHNAMFVLEQLGVADTIRQAGYPVGQGKLGTAQGQVLLQLNYSDFPQYTSIQQTIAIHRASLVQILGQALPPESIVLGARCATLYQTPKAVTIRLQDGREYQGDLVVGTDGIHSTVRQNLWGTPTPRYAGYTCWRGISSFPAWNMNHAGEYWGRGERFGMISISQDRVYWFAVANAPQGQEYPLSQRKTEVLRRFGTWAWDIPAVIEATPAEAILHNDIIDLPPRRNWSQGRVVLSGDAIHPTTPNMGQGACMAIESALTLANHLQQRSSYTEAFRAFEAERYPRTSHITQRSRTIGWIGQWANPIACWFRQWIMQSMNPHKQIQQLLPTIGHEILRVES